MQRGVREGALKSCACMCELYIVGRKLGNLYFGDFHTCTEIEGLQDHLSAERVQ